MQNAAVKIEAEYPIPIEHHNPMEPHATVAVWQGDKLTICDKTSGGLQRPQAPRPVAAESPLAGATATDVELLDGRLQRKSDPSRFVDVAETMKRSGLTENTETFESKPSPERQSTRCSHTARSSSR